MYKSIWKNDKRGPVTSDAYGDIMDSMNELDADKKRVVRRKHKTEWIEDESIDINDLYDDEVTE